MENSPSVENVLDGGVAPMAVLLGEQYVDIQALLGMTPSSNPHPNLNEPFTETDFTQYGQNIGNDDDLMDCQTDQLSDPVYSSTSDAPTSPNDGVVLYEVPQDEIPSNNLMQRQQSIARVQDILGEVSDAESSQLLQNFYNSPLSEIPTHLPDGPQFGESSPQFSIGDTSLIDKDLQLASIDQASRTRYLSLNENDYISQAKDSFNIAVTRQRSMSENHGDVNNFGDFSLLQFASSPEDDQSKTTTNNDSSANDASTSNEATTTTNTSATYGIAGQHAQVTSGSDLANSFMNLGSLDTEAMLQDFINKHTVNQNPKQTQEQVNVRIISVAPEDVLRSKSPLKTIDPISLHSDQPSTSTIQNAPKSRKRKAMNFDERRDKNNEACRLSRKRRKEKKMENERQVFTLTKENEEMNIQIQKLEQEIKLVRNEVMRHIKKF